MNCKNNFSTLLSRSSCILLTLVVLLTSSVNAETVQLQSNNINNILSTHEILFVNFYADWCRFSQILQPVFEETAKKVKEKFPETGKVAFGKVDCDNENGIATQYHISKYPTLKLFRNGQVVKKEYRGQRSVDALAKFIEDQVADPIQKKDKLEEMNNLEENKRNMIGYFEGEETPNYKTFRRISSQLRDDCKFHAATGQVSEIVRSDGGDKVMFRPPMTKSQGETFEGDISNYDEFLAWAQEKCVPVVREITFENAEELTEEGLPFLILFHNPEDTEIVEKYTKAVSTHLMHEKTAINFLTADGKKFTHPLHHLGKTQNDLPVLAIDSFRHMYLFKHDVRTDLDKPGLLQQFIADLHSGKLHREFHHGPEAAAAVPAPQPNQGDPNQPYPVPPLLGADGTTPYPVPPKLKDTDGGDSGTDTSSDSATQPSETGTPSTPEQAGSQGTGTPQHLPHDRNEKKTAQTSPPESVFKKLQPSGNRYTILKDEL